MNKITENTKVTLTLGQLKKLVKEAAYSDSLNEYMKKANEIVRDIVVNWTQSRRDECRPFSEEFFDEEPDAILAMSKLRLALPGKEQELYRSLIRYAFATSY